VAGYLNRFIDLGFPELAGTDEQTGRALCWVKIRNPRLMPGNDITAGGTVATDEHGRPLDTKAAARESFAIMSKLIIAGHVWDATWTPDLDADGNEIDPNAEPPLLPMPASPADVAKMPMQILNAIGEEMSKASPR